MPSLLALFLTLSYSWELNTGTKVNAYAKLTLIELLLSSILVVLIFAVLPFVSNEWLQQSHTKHIAGDITQAFQRRWWTSSYARAVCGRESLCASVCCVARVPRWAVPGLYAVEQWMVESAQIHRLIQERNGTAGSTTGAAHEWGGTAAPPPGRPPSTPGRYHHHGVTAASGERQLKP